MNGGPWRIGSGVVRAVEIAGGCRAVGEAVRGDGAAGAPPSRSLPGAGGGVSEGTCWPGCSLRRPSVRTSVSALAIEKETLELCAERQGLVVNIVQLDRQLEAAVEDRESKTNKPAGAYGAQERRSARRGRGATPPAAAKPPETVVEAPAREGGGGAGKSREPAATRRGAGGGEGGLQLVLAAGGGRGGCWRGLRTGAGTWFVSEGDVLPRGGVVERISGRPPGVEVAGLGLLPWTGKPVAVADVAGADTGVGQATRPGGVVDPGEVRTAQRSALAGHARVVDGDTVEVGGARGEALRGSMRRNSGRECRSGAQDVGLRRARGGGRCGPGRRGCGARKRARIDTAACWGVCFEGREDINAWLVSEGWALAYRRFAKAYVPEETEARGTEARGSIAGEFVAPWGLAAGESGCRALEAKEGEAADLPPLAREELPPLPNAETSPVRIPVLRSLFGRAGRNAENGARTWGRRHAEAAASRRDG